MDRHLMARRPDAATLRAAVWTWRTLVSVRRQLQEDRLEAVVVADPPAVGRAAALRGMGIVLSRRRDSCLVRALVRQHWQAALGQPLDVVIGVKGPVESFTAHAWLDGDTDAGAGWTELSRRPASTRRAAPGLTPSRTISCSTARQP